MPDFDKGAVWLPALPPAFAGNVEFLVDSFSQLVRLDAKPGCLRGVAAPLE